MEQTMTAHDSLLDKVRASANASAMLATLRAAFPDANFNVVSAGRTHTLMRSGQVDASGSFSDIRDRAVDIIRYWSE
jgi:hypothetical protein